MTSFSLLMYSYGSPVLILDLAHIEQGVPKIYFRVGHWPGCGHTHSMTNLHLYLKKELEGKQIHQNVQKHQISGGRNKN